MRSWMPWWKIDMGSGFTDYNLMCSLSRLFKKTDVKATYYFGSSSGGLDCLSLIPRHCLPQRHMLK